MRFSFWLILLVATFALTVTSTYATDVSSPSDSKKLEVKKALTRLRKMHSADKEERNPAAAAHYYLHSPQSSQILHAVEDGRPLSKGAKAFIAVVSVGIITGAIVGSIMLVKKVISQPDSDAQ
ncbi:hypothetical protein DVH05_015522 [Phytophthora capsici]|nr:hypothetical protein DVH05_018458 [Phytophthora capsici]KAG1698039.1 hypothetical protein DVH05_015522 [Phytophthora capsici]